jgi:hypothetical protein
MIRVLVSQGPKTNMRDITKNIGRILLEKTLYISAPGIDEVNSLLAVMAPANAVGSEKCVAYVEKQSTS